MKNIFLSKTNLTPKRIFLFWTENIFQKCKKIKNIMLFVDYIKFFIDKYFILNLFFNFIY
jgi:hypothetical protein